MDKDEMIFRALVDAIERGGFTDAQGQAFPIASNLSAMVTAGEHRLYCNSHGHPLRKLVAFRNAASFMRGESLPYPDGVFAPHPTRGPDATSAPFAS